MNNTKFRELFDQPKKVGIDVKATETKLLLVKMDKEKEEFKDKLRKTKETQPKPQKKQKVPKQKPFRVTGTVVKAMCANCQGKRMIDLQEPEPRPVLESEDMQQSEPHQVEEPISEEPPQEQSVASQIVWIEPPKPTRYERSIVPGFRGRIF